LINREIVCGIASEENDDFITVEGSDIATIINMWY
jgi:fructose-1,6-bisphosphatase I